MVEILIRLGFALVLSLCLAVLFAWGWDRSDTLPGSGDASAQLMNDTSAAPPR